MRFRQSIVDLERFLRSRFRLREALLRGRGSEAREKNVGIRQPGVG